MILRFKILGEEDQYLEVNTLTKEHYTNIQGKTIPETFTVGDLTIGTNHLDYFFKVREFLAKHGKLIEKTPPLQKYDSPKSQALIPFLFSGQGRISDILKMDLSQPKNPDPTGVDGENIFDVVWAIFYGLESNENTKAILSEILADEDSILEILIDSTTPHEVLGKFVDLLGPKFNEIQLPFSPEGFLKKCVTDFLKQKWENKNSILKKLEEDFAHIALSGLFS